MQCGHLLTKVSMNVRIFGQKNLMRNLYSVLYLPMWPPAGDA